MNIIDLIRIAGPDALLVSDQAGEAHVIAGPLTPSGRLPETSDRTCSRAHNRQLEVLPGRWSSLTTASPVPRLCARCVARLSSSCEGVNDGSRATLPVNRDDWAAAYAGVTVAELATAVHFATTVDETHRIGFVAQRLFGPPPIRHPRSRLTAAADALVDLHAAITSTRRRLTTAERNRPAPAATG